MSNFQSFADFESQTFKKLENIKETYLKGLVDVLSEGIPVTVYGTKENERGELKKKLSQDQKDKEVSKEEKERREKYFQHHILGEDHFDLYNDRPDAKVASWKIKGILKANEYENIKSNPSVSTEESDKENMTNTDLKTTKWKRGTPNTPEESNSKIKANIISKTKIEEDMESELSDVLKKKLEARKNRPFTNSYRNLHRDLKTAVKHSVKRDRDLESGIKDVLKTKLKESSKAELIALAAAARKDGKKVTRIKTGKTGLGLSDKSWQQILQGDKKESDFKKPVPVTKTESGHEIRRKIRRGIGSS